MNKMTNSLILGSVLAASTLVSGAAFAELTTNVGVTSNYLWRGVTQSADLSAISGGIDYSHESGFYAGTWTSSLASGQYELDLYAGFSGEASSVSYDVGLIQYMYPIGDVKLDFTEAQATVGYGPVSLYIAQTVGTEDSSAAADSLYVALSAETAIDKDYTVGFTFGSYSGDDIKAAFGDDYTHLAVKLSKGDFAFAIEKNDIDNVTMVDNDPRVTVSWGKSF
jgi:uncharacterized protein (TIGR02001 family)